MEDFLIKRNSKITHMTWNLMKDKNITDVTELQSILKETLKNGVEAMLEYWYNKVI